MTNRRVAPFRTITAVCAGVWLLGGCAAQAQPQPRGFELSGRIGIEGTAQFQQPVLVDGQGKKWLLDCTQGVASTLQGRLALLTVTFEGTTVPSTLGVPRVCVQTITPR